MQVAAGGDEVVEAQLAAITGGLYPCDRTSAPRAWRNRPSRCNARVPGDCLRVGVEREVDGTALKRHRRRRSAAPFFIPG